MTVGDMHPLTVLCLVVGAVVVATLLIFAIAIALKSASDRLTREVLRFRRIRFIWYWANRLEKEGTLDMDKFYRQQSKGEMPKTIQEALRWESEAQSASNKERNG